MNDVTRLIDLESGLVDRRVFSDPDIYRQELRRVFGTSWLFLCHESQLTQPGDFFHTYMGADPVLVVRQRDGSLRAMLNVCRHRGMRVMKADFGNAKAFTCSYHGWSYDTTGRLVALPNSDAYGDALPREAWGMRPVPRVDVYRGLVFGTWTQEGPGLVESLGDMTWYLDATVNRSDAGTTVIGRVMKWTLKGNWKLAAEQFASDMYHVNTSHASALAAMSPDGRPPKPEILNRSGRQFSDPATGHGTGFFTHPRNRFDDQAVHKHYDRDELVRRLGEARVAGPTATGHATIFPNFSYLPVNGSLRVWHPRGPDETEVWAWTLVDKDMPEEVKESQRLYALRTFGPTGIFEADDGENWSEIQSVSAGAVASATPLNYRMGLRPLPPDPDYPSANADVMSDAAARAFYGRWLVLMSTPSWLDANGAGWMA